MQLSQTLVISQRQLDTGFDPVLPPRSNARWSSVTMRSPSMILDASELARAESTEWCAKGEGGYAHSGHLRVCCNPLLLIADPEELTVTDPSLFNILSRMHEVQHCVAH